MDAIEKLQQRRRRLGSYVSLIYRFVQRGDASDLQGAEKRAIEFRIYRPARPSDFACGRFQQLEPGKRPVRKEGWRVAAEAALPGTYRYKYIIDGTWSVDLHNRDSASDATGDVCSIIRIPR